MLHELPAANALLGHLNSVVGEHLHGCVVEFKSGDTLFDAGGPEVEVYFPITAVLSLMSTMASGDSCEVALVGREGMVGLSGVLGGSETVTSCVALVGGSCFRVPAESLRFAAKRDDFVREVLDHYTTARLVQVAQVAACNRLHSVGSRLARWLLMLRDRIDGDHLRLSQQAIADALGVHRPTIALELQRLHGTGAVFYRSRMMKIIDRTKLESLACECHQTLHREYVELFRPMTTGAHGSAQQKREPASAAVEALRAIAGRLLVANLQEQAARERAEASDRAKDHFLAVVSHELRAPLHAIMGWCALAKHPNPPPEALDIIERNARAQSAMIEDLLEASRSNANTLHITPREVQPLAVVESALDSIRPVAEGKHVSLRLKVLDELPPIVADGDRVRQVMINVLLNSVKFSREGGTVDTQVSVRNSGIEVRVTDYGQGIPRFMLPHVFERFWQAEGSRARRQGLGLGLNIARALVELHGGSISLDSGGEDQGTTCTITLPQVAEPARLDSQTLSSPSAGGN